jgi:hypothetical protein
MINDATYAKPRVAARGLARSALSRLFAVIVYRNGLAGATYCSLLCTGPSHGTADCVASLRGGGA